MRADSTETAERAEHCVVLAGGRGRRLGGGKPLRALAGRPLISYPIAAARTAGLRPVIACKPETDLGPFDTTAVVVLREPTRPSHPLLGIATALRALDAPVVVCPCDLPLIPAALLAHLAGLSGEAVVAGHDAIDPLLGRYGPGSIPALERAVTDGLAARTAVAALDPLLVGTEQLSAFGDPAAMLSNANTAEDLRRIERALG